MNRESSAGGNSSLLPLLDDTAARHDPRAFAEEQARLGKVWTFLGLGSDVSGVNDWFTAPLGGRSIVVQRFEAGLRAFENRCAHRGYPLRTEARGNGALVCGFHHWRYNADGLALGIPECPAMFGKTPRELDARLEPVEIAECGGLIFGRFGDGTAISLRDWLGPAFPILAHISDTLADGLAKPAGAFERVVRANWRYMMDISLDDYHIVAVHPSTFGQEGYIPAGNIHYARFGAHSAYLSGGEADELTRFARNCEAGTFVPARYRILQIFPTLIVSTVRALRFNGESYWFLVLQHLVPEAHDRTRSISRFFPLRQAETDSLPRKLIRKALWPGTSFGFRYYARRVHMEDNAVCETLQAAARPDTPPPRLARQEERIGWFSDSYVRIMAGEMPSAAAKPSDA